MLPETEPPSVKEEDTVFDLTITATSMALQLRQQGIDIETHTLTKLEYNHNSSDGQYGKSGFVSASGLNAITASKGGKPGMATFSFPTDAPNQFEWNFNSKQPVVLTLHRRDPKMTLWNAEQDQNYAPTEADEWHVAPRDLMPPARCKEVKEDLIATLDGGENTVTFHNEGETDGEFNRLVFEAAVSLKRVIFDSLPVQGTKLNRDRNGKIVVIEKRPSRSS
ncbi:hypothetical protein C8R46DRAFT_1295064 [Mycena filopes]|nr:hypothetical protein C8R46DRAFT_1295064 [Mycena filopes]